MKSKSFNIAPNIERVLVRPINFSEGRANEILIPGQMKAGENLFLGEIVHAGSTKFKVGQRVYYSEYSAAAIFPLHQVIDGTMKFGEATTKENTMMVVAEDDIMAYEEKE